MFSRKILFFSNVVRPSFVLRTFKNRNVKANLVNKNKNVKGNPGGNRIIAMMLDGDSPEMSNVTLEDFEDGENDMLNSHLLYDQHMK